MQHLSPVQESDGLSAGGSRLRGQIFNRETPLGQVINAIYLHCRPFMMPRCPRSASMHLHAALQINAVAAAPPPPKKASCLRHFEANGGIGIEKNKTKPDLQTWNFHTVGTSRLSVRDESEGFSGGCLE